VGSVVYPDSLFLARKGGWGSTRLPGRRRKKNAPEAQRTKKIPRELHLANRAAIKQKKGTRTYAPDPSGQGLLHNARDKVTARDSGEKDWAEVLGWRLNEGVGTRVPGYRGKAGEVEKSRNSIGKGGKRSREGSRVASYAFRPAAVAATKKNTGEGEGQKPRSAPTVRTRGEL